MRHLTEISSISIENTKTNKLLNNLWPCCYNKPNKITALEDSKSTIFLVQLRNTVLFVDRSTDNILLKEDLYVSSRHHRLY